MILSSISFFVTLAESVLVLSDVLRPLIMKNNDAANNTTITTITVIITDVFS